MAREEICTVSLRGREAPDADRRGVSRGPGVAKILGCVRSKANNALRCARAVPSLHG